MVRTTLGGMVAALALAVVALLPHHHAGSPAVAHRTIQAAHASWVRPGSTAALVKASDAVVRGTVTAVHEGAHIAAKGHPDMFMPTQRVQVRVTETLRGKAPGTVTVFQVGGVAPSGNLMYVEGDPLYKVGDDVVLFLQPGSPGLYHTGPDGRLDVQGGTTHAHISNGVGRALAGLTVAQVREKVNR